MAARFGGRFYNRTIAGGDDDLLVFWRRIDSYLLRLLNRKLSEMGAIKASLAVHVRLEKDDEEALAVLRSKSMTLLQSSDIEEEIDIAREESLEKLAKWTREGSGWIVDEVEKMKVSLVRYELTRGGSYKELPQWIKKKNAIVNVQNKDDRCFLWAIRSALYEPLGKSNRTTSYPSDDLDWSDMEFPVKIKDINKFEANNDIRINVYGCYDGVIVPLKLADNPEVHLFHYGDHYSWVKSPNRLLGRINKHGGGDRSICYNCMQPFNSKEILREHKKICRRYSEVATQIRMPNKEFRYNDYQKQLPVPYVIYADFESILLPDGTHEACSYGYMVVRQDGKTGQPQTYRGPNAAKKLLESLREVEEDIREELLNPEGIRMTRKDKNDHAAAEICHICEEPLERFGRRDKACYDGKEYLGDAHWGCGKYDKGKRKEEPSSHCIYCQEKIEEEWYEDKVRDHCHVTGKYRGAAHWKCNVNFRINPEMEIPVFFHNLRGYDSHLLLQGVTDEKVKCIPTNKEKYLSISIGGLRFLDSMQFLMGSLDSLVKAAPSLPISDKYGAERKGVYPYEWMDGWHKFEESLPPKEAFYSKLKREGISDDDYQHAKTIWEKHGCLDMGDYHDIYLLSDVTLLADIFQGFRKMSMEYYGLDPANFYTAPGLSWSALLKMTKPKLDLFTDYDMQMFIEDGIRGGVCGPSVRYAKANNPMVNDYDPSKPNDWIYYLDANNLYGWAMSQPLPVRDFEWDTRRDWECFDVPVDSPTGYILEVDLGYPEELHKDHNDFPMAPEKREIPFEMLSDYQREMLPEYKSYPKLAMTLLPKKNYVVHYRNLQFYLRHGLRLVKIHRVLRFTQEAWMKPYIDFNTQKRAASKVKCEQDLFKLMNNSVFGKTMENVRKRVNLRIVGTEDEAVALASKPGYTGRFEMQNFWVVGMKKSVLLFNKPVYTGFSVLDLSKLLMYEFYYENLKPKYGNNCSLLYTDTDSLIMSIQTDDIYKDTLEDLDEYDTSGYPADHFLYSAKNKKVIGKMKDEMSGVPIEEYVGLRPKMYSLKHGGKETKKAKGVKKVVVRKDLKHNSYVAVLRNKDTLRHSSSSIRSIGHDVRTVEQNKVSLSAFDGKRYILDDGINTLAFGHVNSRA